MPHGSRTLLDDTVKLWEAASGREVRTLGHPRKSVPE
jgi:hypothetical protein